MPMKIRCKCGAAFTVRDELAGSKIACVTCGSSIKVPAPVAVETPVWQSPASQAVSPAPRSGGAALVALVALLGVIAAGVGLFLVNNRLTELQLSSVAANEAAKNNDVKIKEAQDRAAVLQKEAAQASDRLTALAEDTAKATKHRDGIVGRLASLQVQTADLQQKLAKIDEEKAKLTEDAKEGWKEKVAELEKQALEDRTKMLTVSDNADQLSTDLAAANKKLENLDEKLSTAQEDLASKINALPTSLDVDKKLIDAKNDLIAKMNALPIGSTTIINKTFVTNSPGSLPGPAIPASQNPAERIVFHNAPTGSPFVFLFSMNTATGRTTFKARNTNTSFTFPIFLPIPESLSAPAPGPPGRYDINVTEKPNGDFEDVVRLDTHTGDAWFFDGLQWRAIFNGSTNPAPQSVYRLAVQPRNRTFAVSDLRPFAAPRLWTNTNRGMFLIPVP